MAPLARGDVGGRKGAGVAGDQHAAIGNLEHDVDVGVAVNTCMLARDDEPVA